MLFMMGGCYDNAPKKDAKAEDKHPKTEKVVVATSADNPPLSYHRLGKISGFEIELFEKIAKELKWQIEWKDLNFDTLVAAVQTKKVDFAISAIAVTDERKKSVDFSIPYHDSTLAVVVAKESGIKGTKELKDSLIAAQAGSAYEKAASSFNPKAKFFPRVPELVTALNNSQIKALIIGSIEAESLIKNNDNLSFFLVPGHDEKFAIALPKGSKHLKEINSVLAKFEKDGTIATLAKKYLKA